MQTAFFRHRLVRRLPAALDTPSAPSSPPAPPPPSPAPPGRSPSDRLPLLSGEARRTTWPGIGSGCTWQQRQRQFIEYFNFSCHYHFVCFIYLLNLLLHRRCKSLSRFNFCDKAAEKTSCTYKWKGKKTQCIYLWPCCSFGLVHYIGPASSGGLLRNPY